MLCFEFFPRSLDDVDVGVHWMSTFRRQVLACLMGCGCGRRRHYFDIVVLSLRCFHPNS